MTPDFENLKIYGDEIVCCLINGNRVSSFNFVYDSNDSLKLSSNLKLIVNNDEYVRRCQLIKNSNTELYLKFRKISLQINENYICQVFIKSNSFSCLSCNQHFTNQNLSPCCSFKHNLIKINSGEIYKISFLDHSNFNSRCHDSKNEFKLLHFRSVVDTMLLGDPI